MRLRRRYDALEHHGERLASVDRRFSEPFEDRVNLVPDTAQQERWALHSVSGNLALKDDGYEAAHARTDAAWKREYEALETSIACRPTTVEALQALRAYVGQPEDGPDCDETDTIIAGAIRSGRITGTEWSRHLGRVAERLARHPAPNTRGDD
jgi:hypothetical protein